MMRAARGVGTAVRRVAGVAIVALTAACAGHPPAATSPALPSAEARTAARLESLRGSPLELFAFLRRFPKGGDLHTHLGGSIYAESYIAWAADAGLCLSSPPLLALVPPPCAPPDRPPIAGALTDATLYGRLIDAWSMRHWELSGQSGHDHFFDVGSRFALATSGRIGDMLAENASRAAVGRVSYVESMISPDSGGAAAIGDSVPWTGDLVAMRAAIEPRLSPVVDQSLVFLTSAEARKRDVLGCATAAPQPGCGVTVRYLYQVIRSRPPSVVFAQMLTAFMLASRPGSPVVGLNLVAPEDGPVAMHDFALHMAMLRFLAPSFPTVHIALHAGELAPGLVPPDGLRGHIRESVASGALRIGHGVDVMYEDDAEPLLDEMAAKQVLVEICLTSNDLILGVRGAEHPLPMYLRHGVPVALATDDEGISRTDITQEYWRAARDYQLPYRDLKSMARMSLEHAFVEGASLWRDIRRGSRVDACASDSPAAPPAGACAAWLATSAKARLQWALEADLAAFEREQSAVR